MKPRNKLNSLHFCGFFCLKPLVFHSEAIGSQVSLSLGARFASRDEKTFRNGLVFSSRPVQTEERVCLRVDRCALPWEGALRVGFTAVPPSSRALPPFAIPDLTHSPGYWAALVPEMYSFPSSELQFWVTSQGSLFLKASDGQRLHLLDGLDATQPLWAMIDLYGQTCAVLLLGSKKKNLFGVRKSCPMPLPLPVSSGDNHPRVSKARSASFIPMENMQAHLLSNIYRKPTAEPTRDCIVCESERSCIVLNCGHQYLCLPCATRVCTRFGTCSLCRRPITSLLLATTNLIV